MNHDRIFTLLSRKLSGESTASEQEELDEVMKLYPNYQTPFEVIEEYWNMASENDKDFLEATYHLHLNRLKERGFDFNEIKKDDKEDTFLNIPGTLRKQNILKKLLVACAFLLLSATFIFIFYNHNKKLTASNSIEVAKLTQSEVSTKNGSRTKIQLPDGTSVWLNGNSKLVYNNKHYGEILREVSLSGEGYFEVVKNPEKPFVIHTSKMDIKVLGTVFNVRCYPGEKKTETSLIRGSIEVTVKSRKEKIMMKPSEKLILTDDDVALKPGKVVSDEKQNIRVQPDPIILLRHLTVLPQDSTIVETAWVENRLVFSSESFEEVALKMEKWYGVEIKFDDEKLKAEPLTATFRKETVNEALHALQLTTRFNYKINNDIITISK